MKSRMNKARGSMSPFPSIASNIEKADKPFMFSGLRKFVHWKTKKGSEEKCIEDKK